MAATRETEPTRKRRKCRALEMLGGVVFSQGLVEDLIGRIEVARRELVLRAHQEGASQAEIAGVLGVSQQYVSRLLRELVEDAG